MYGDMVFNRWCQIVDNIGGVKMLGLDGRVLNWRYRLETERGNVVWYELNYTLGGRDYWTGGMRDRGYYLNIRRNRDEFLVGEGLHHNKGAIQLLVHPVKRRGSKQEEIAWSNADATILGVLDSYNL